MGSSGTTNFLPPLLCVLGVSLRRQVRDATAEVLEGVTQLLEVILSSPLQRYMLQKNTRLNNTALSLKCSCVWISQHPVVLCRMPSAKHFISSSFTRSLLHSHQNAIFLVLVRRVRCCQNNFGIFPTFLFFCSPLV